MNKYEVAFVREYYSTIIIEAESEEEALLKAEKEFDNIEWDLSDENIGHEDIAQILDIEIAHPNWKSSENSQDKRNSNEQTRNNS